MSVGREKEKEKKKEMEMEKEEKKQTPGEPSSANSEQNSVDVPGDADEEPVCVTFADVSAAPFRIRDGVPQTPCEVRL